MIPNATLKIALRLGAIVPPAQVSVLYKGPETGNQVQEISTGGDPDVKTGTVVRRFGEFSPSTVADYFSQVRGRAFFLPSLEPEDEPVNRSARKQPRIPTDFDPKKERIKARQKKEGLEGITWTIELM